MSDLVTANRYATTDDGWSTATRRQGRHAFDEDAALTPIFHALTRGGWRSRQHEQAAAQRQSRQPVGDPVEAFRRDPLTAPIPVIPAEPPAASSRGQASGAHAAVPEARPEMDATGRHHYRREHARTAARW